MENIATKDERKEKAIEVMKEMDIYKPYIRDFRTKDYVCFFEGFAGFYTFQEKEIQDKLKEVEKKLNCTVFAVTHECLEFGECYDFLFISQYKEDWDYNFEKVDSNQFYVFAYVWNKDNDDWSEFGTISVKSALGGLIRVA